MANVIGTNNADTINSLDGVTNGADTISGFGGNDSIFGLGGHDLIKGGGGADTIDGGAGIDTAEYTDSDTGVTVNLETGEGAGGTAEGDTLISVENLTGTIYDDLLTGNGGANVLTGLAGNDILKGGGGADTLHGDDGNDTLKGGGGADTINGGDGIDTVAYNQSAVGVEVDLLLHTATGGDATGDVFNSIENVTGSDDDDKLNGDDGVNVIKGLDGSDQLLGRGGADVMWGGGDVDKLYGGDGNDTLYGEDGNDMLEGMAGDDTMIGGAGDDGYHIDSVGDVVIEQAGGGTADRVSTYLAHALADNVEQLLLYGSADINAVGNAGDNTINGNAGNNGIDGGDGADYLRGLEGNDAFIFGAGQAHGDMVEDFQGNGAAAGDLLLFSGYGPGATFTQIDASHWQVNYNGGASHDVITFFNGAGNAIHASDYVFV